VWSGSAYNLVHDVLIPLLRSGALVPAAAWALAAVVLPWLVLAARRCSISFA